MATQPLRVVISSDSEGDDPTYRTLLPFFVFPSRARFEPPSAPLIAGFA
jgi:hypothetical protein